MEAKGRIDVKRTEAEHGIFPFSQINQNERSEIIF